MFQILNPKNSPTTTLQSEMLELLQALQSSLSLSRQSNHQLALTEITDCIHEIALVDKAPIDLSLEVSWMVQQIESLRCQKLCVFNFQEEKLWEEIKRFILTYPLSLREAFSTKDDDLSLENI